jgi:hypothetical protein
LRSGIRHRDNELSRRARNDQRPFLGRSSDYTALRVPRDERLGSFGITARKIDTAHRPISRVWAKRSTRVIEFRIKNIFAMTAGADAVIDDKR